MVFSSHIFLFYFLPLALLLYYSSPRWLKHLTLTALSYTFYGWANPLFVLLMFGSTLIDYVAGLVQTGHFRLKTWREPIAELPKAGQRTRTQKIALWTSIVSNLTLLGFFKYFNFFTANWTELVQAIGLEGLGIENVMRVTLPLGISFYTFQSMSYAIDVYRGHARAIRNPIDFWCFVSLFPQLVAGPIIRFSEVADQLRSRTHTVEKFVRGIAFLFLGLSKKVLLANPCGKVADMAFDAASVTTIDAWVGAVAYAFQIYFDFSAYSDMAIGLGLMLGFVFAKNFDSPYLSASITEFWRRWHISLSSWLRDYLYIPLGGNRLGEGRTYINLMLVMLLGGLWHGSSWNFLIWGAIHGGMLAFERAQGKQSVYAGLPHGLKVMITFIIVCIAWVFFRAPDLGSALAYCGSMFGLAESTVGAHLLGGLIYQPYYVGFLAIAAMVTWFGPQTWDFTRQLTLLKAATIVGLFVVSVVALTVQEYNPFIYFIF